MIIRSYIEAELLEESKVIQQLDEAMTLKFTKKADVPENFKKFASKMAGIFEEEMDKKLGSGFFSAAYGIRFGNVKKKIDSKAPKNCYYISIPYKSIVRKQTGEKAKFGDNFFGSIPMIENYITGVFKKCGLKQFKNSFGNSSGMWCKNSDGCIFCCNYSIDNGIVVYIRCIEDSKRNRAFLSGGERFVKESTITKLMESYNPEFVEL